MISSIHNLPQEWIGVMRKMAMSCEHFLQAVTGDLSEEDESSEEDDDTESNDESESD